MSFAIQGFAPTGQGTFGLATQVAAVGSAAGASSASAAMQHRKLVDAAQQFEGMLLQEMLKPMKERGFCQKEGEDNEASDGSDSGGGGDTLSSYGTETMATAIAKGGGLGIARRVVEQVEGESSSRSPATPQTDFRNNQVTVLKS